MIESKNAVIIIGNGFDMAKGLPTGYNDFSNYFIEEVLGKLLQNRKIEDSLFSMSFRSLVEKYRIYQPLKFEDNSLEYLAGIYHKRFSKPQDEISFLKSNKELIIKIISNGFLGKLFADSYEDWFNIEKAFFIELRNLYNLVSRQNLDKKSRTHFISRIEKLNQDLNDIKTYLISYLKTITYEDQQEISDFFRNNFDTKEEIFIINFNYTSTVESYIRYCFPDKKVEINYIHGSLEENRIIFGYGNDNHEDYQKMKDSEIDEFLANFKTYEYSDTNDYQKIYSQLIDFYRDYEVYVVGHSLSSTDKTLLKEIIDIPKCKKVHLFKRVYEDDDNSDFKKHKAYKELLYNLSRVISSTEDVRKKVVNYEDSVHFPYISLEEIQNKRSNIYNEYGGKVIVPRIVQD